MITITHPGLHHVRDLLRGGSSGLKSTDRMWLQRRGVPWVERQVLAWACRCLRRGSAEGAGRRLARLWRGSASRSGRTSSQRGRSLEGSMRWAGRRGSAIATQVAPGRLLCDTHQDGSLDKT
jgi:hypothetical protein